MTSYDFNAIIYRSNMVMLLKLKDGTEKRDAYLKESKKDGSFFVKTTLKEKQFLEMTNL